MGPSFGVFLYIFVSWYFIYAEIYSISHTLLKRVPDEQSGSNFWKLMSTLYINIISEGFKIAIREKKLSPSRNQRIEKSSVKSYRQLRQLLTTTLRHAPKKYIKKGITH